MDHGSLPLLFFPSSHVILPLTLHSPKIFIRVPTCFLYKITLSICLHNYTQQKKTEHHFYYQNNRIYCPSSISIHSIPFFPLLLFVLSTKPFLCTFTTKASNIFFSTSSLPQKTCYVCKCFIFWSNIKNKFSSLFAFS